MDFLPNNERRDSPLVDLAAL